MKKILKRARVVITAVEIMIAVNSVVNTCYVTCLFYAGLVVFILAWLLVFILAWLHVFILAWLHVFILA